ncbi:o-succinylbenzoate--CoA ligase [Pseudanabaena mucicola]|uniref:2-succinylbenzoate--CoA ligase n=1 Tax=Pseudanabaena mucicola FACHB-723 TaxID=2692860 RepID=A0ABR7ZSN8_9CYAN|nr:o-succinylbenzoate--CoA ligase [Pseudanabaena mucicola]MBD2186564.1 o-succinylbenzoate--CoA ligase [Pseudanabaena mucicola FACHB-723]
MKFPNWLSQRAVQKKDAIAIIFKSDCNKSWTYSELNQEVDQWVAFLRSQGIGSGDRVGLLLNNHPRYIMLVHALNKCGAVAIFLNIRLTAAELSWQIEDSQAKYLLCDQVTNVIASGFQQDQTTKNQVQIVEVDQTLTFTVKCEEIPSLSAREFPQDINLADVQGIFYTSGTTGKPKGVPLTYGNHFHSAIASALHLGIEPSDNWLLCMPLFHVGGLAIAWRSVINGTTLTLLPRFDEQMVLDAIAECRVTIISLVPTMLIRLLQHDQWQNLQQLRAILLGGAPVSDELIERCQQLNLPIMPTYGMTETASQITTLSPDQVATKLGSSGLPLLGNRIRIVDIDNPQQEMSQGKIGQILVQGASVMSGYLNHRQPDAIQDGWLYTGDLGYLDAEGYLYVVSRRNDLIISGGENIYPHEIETILLSHPAISEACVVGICDRDWGESVAAVIVSSEDLSLAAVRTFCEQKSLARYKLPKLVSVWKSLPKTASGKLLRQEIRNRLRDSLDHSSF